MKQADTARNLFSVKLMGNAEHEGGILFNLVRFDLGPFARYSGIRQKNLLPVWKDTVFQ